MNAVSLKQVSFGNTEKEQTIARTINAGKYNLGDTRVITKRSMENPQNVSCFAQDVLSQLERLFNITGKLAENQGINLDITPGKTN